MIELEDLLTKCTDKNSKSYIEEAIKAYKNGAYRACINSTWLAVFTNIIYKIEQLALLNDSNAIQYKNNIDKVRQNNDIKGMLELERDILDISFNDFEFIDSINLIDLKRLQEDRNRSSHPLKHSEDEIFSPSAYQARHHLQIAVEKLISESNVYGKSVLEQILNMLDEPYYQMNYKDSIDILSKSYLASPRKSLLTNLTKVLIKNLLNENLDLRKEEIQKNTLKYLLDNHYYAIEETLAESLSTIVSNSPLKFKNINKVLSINDIFWEYISSDIQLLIQNYIKDLPKEDFENLQFYLSKNYSHDSAFLRLKKSKNKELFEFNPTNPQEDVVDFFIDKYISSTSFDSANNFAPILINFIEKLNNEKLEKLLKESMSNDQITLSHQFKNVIKQVKKTKKLSDDIIENILNTTNTSEED